VSERGKVGQCRVHPIKPTLKAPGIKLLKLTCDKPLSKSAFDFNLRRYSKVEALLKDERDRHMQVGFRV
jgi:hypothetical protein